MRQGSREAGVDRGRALAAAFGATVMWLAGLAAVSAMASRADAQTTIYVNAAAAPGGDGQSWNSAFTDIEPALVAATGLGSPGNPAQIWIASGIYRPTDERNPGDPRSARYRMRAHTRLIGGFAGNESTLAERDWRANPTIITGDRFNNDGPNFANYGDNLRHLIADDTPCCTDNTVPGFSIDGLELRAVNFDVPDGFYGGAIQARQNSIDAFNCSFLDNDAPGSGAAAVNTNLGNPRFVNCIFRNNRAQGPGAVYIDRGTFINCVFAGNEDASPASFLDGGGGAIQAATGLTITNCTFYANRALNHAIGGIQIQSGGQPTTVNNSILWDNIGSAGVTPTAQIANSVSSSPPSFSGITLNYSITVPGSPFGLQYDPQFADPLGPDGIAGTADDNLALKPCSIASDAGNDNLVPADIADLDADGNTAEPTPTDLAGAARFQMTPGVPQTGLGIPPFVAIGAFESNQNPPVIYVNASATGRDLGSSWADAYTDLQSAFNDTVACPRIIWVAAGTYRPAGFNGPRTATIQLRDGVQIYGGFAGTETELSQRDIAANPTILSGDLSADDDGDFNLSENSYNVVSATGVGATAILDGLSIIGGVGGPMPAGPTASGMGGGLFLTDSSPIVRNCMFSGNRAPEGGAVAIWRSSAPHFENCSLNANQATNNFSGRGGGVFCGTDGAGVPNPRFVQCSFIGNRSPFNEGAGLNTTAGAVTLIGCRFLRNTGYAGGGISARDATLNLANCEVSTNRAIYAGGVLTSNTTFSAVNCVFSTNVVTGSNGGGLYLDGTSSFNQCTIAFNRQPLVDYGGAGVAAVGPTSIVNTIVVQNISPPSIGVQHSQVHGTNMTFASCIVQGWDGTLGGPSNNGLDPIFVRPASAGLDGMWGTDDDDPGDLRQVSGSPAIDSGNNTLVPTDVFDVDGDGNFAESLPIDLAGLPRVADDPQTSDTGIGSSSPYIDRGAYEVQHNCLACPGIREWRNPVGGDFEYPGNWFPSVPNSVHDTLFDLAATYAVEFPSVPNQASRSANIRRGHVIWNLDGSIYTLGATDGRALVVGDDSPVPTSLGIEGGRVNAASAIIGDLPGSAGLCTIGSGATLAVLPANLIVGYEGAGTLNVGAGGRLVTRNAFLGFLPGSTTNVTVSGAGGRWDNQLTVFVDNGSLHIGPGGVLTSGFPVYVLPNGSLSGEGTINTDVVNIGSIEPGSSPGTLTINGLYDQVGFDPEFGSESGSVRIEIAGPLDGEFDQLIVNGPVSLPPTVPAAVLGGGLFVEFMDGYTPQPDQLGEYPTFRLFESSSVLTTRFDVAFFPPVPASQGTGKFLRAVYPNRGPGAVDLIIADLGTNPDFNDPDSFEILGGPTAAAVGDLNRDGLPDLAITLPDVEDPDNEDGVLVILFNQGLDVNEQWQGFGSATQVNVEKFPSGVAIGDFDGIQGNDVVVTNMRSNTVSVVGQQAAAGNFASALIVPTGNEPTAIISFNLDRAGRVDLAVAEGADNTVAMFANDNMSGTPGFTRTVTAPVGTRPSALRPYNPDNDKDLDVAVVNRGSSSLSVLPNLGFGTFAAAITIAVGDEPVGLIAAGLLDRDEEDIREDLVVVNRGGGSVSVIVNTTPIAVTNTLSFAPAVESVLVTSDAEGSQPSSLAAVDMDDDGDRDVAVLARSTDNSGTVVRVLRNDLNGGEQLAFVESAELPAGLGPVAVLSADVDGDGRQDLITVNAQGPRGPGTGTVQTLRNALPPPPSACPADYDNNGQVQVSDIFTFLTAWFAGVPAAYSFGGTPGVPAIFAFLTAWFAGC